MSGPKTMLWPDVTSPDGARVARVQALAVPLVLAALLTYGALAGSDHAATYELNRSERGGGTIMILVSFVLLGLAVWRIARGGAVVTLGLLVFLVFGAVLFVLADELHIARANWAYGIQPDLLALSRLLPALILFGAAVNGLRGAIQEKKTAAASESRT